MNDARCVDPAAARGFATRQDVPAVLKYQSVYCEVPVNGRVNRKRQDQASSLTNVFRLTWHGVKSRCYLGPWGVNATGEPTWLCLPCISFGAQPISAFAWLWR